MNSNDFRIALYARVSTEAQEDEGQSLITQLEMMRLAAGQLGATVAEEYQIQESAMPGRERPSLTRLLKDAAAGRFDAVMVCKMDRLSRSIESWTHVENSLRTFGIALYEGRDRHNLQSAEGRLNRGMQALIGEYAVNRLKWSACASRLERARRGWPHSGMLPFGRQVKQAKDRRNADAEWVLDPEKVVVAAEMYRLYIAKGLNLTQVGKHVGMHPETVRRIMIEQSGPEWVRTFVDPATGERVEIRTAIPPLFTDAQRARLQDRAKQNQLERANWQGRTRQYPLASYLRCANPACGWSNLSGHQSTDKRNAVDGAPPKQRAYYLHLARNRKDCGCLTGLPAGDIEDEVLSRLGQFLVDSGQLAGAVRAALVTNAIEAEGLQGELVELTSARKQAAKVLANAMELLYEHKGSPAALLARAKVDEQNALIGVIDSRVAEIREAIKVVEIPPNLGGRLEGLLRSMVGLNGFAPMHWPAKAQKALLSIFFGGRKSTRFDRNGKHEKSDKRGIFVAKVTPEDGAKPYFVYEARGSIVDFSGALTRVVEVYESEVGQGSSRRFSVEELAELTDLAASIEGAIRFRSSPHADRRWSA